MKGILFFDIDGTLVNSHETEKVEPEVEAAVMQAKKNGYLCLLSTGRNIGGIKDYIDLMDGAVFCDGAGFLYEGKVYDLKPIREELLKELQVQVLEQYHGSLIMWGNYDFYASDRQFDEWTAMAEQRRKERGEDTEEDMIQLYMKRLDAYNGEPITELDIFLPDEETEKQFMRTLNPDLAYISTSASYGRDGNTCGEVTAAGCSKGNGAIEAAKRFGVDIKDTYAFGDSMNDASIIQACGTGIVMGNGADELKAMADYVTDDIEEHGLVNAMKHFGIIA